MIMTVMIIHTMIMKLTAVVIGGEKKSTRAYLQCFHQFSKLCHILAKATDMHRSSVVETPSVRTNTEAQRH